MPLNSAGLNSPFSIDTISVHNANPGLGATPTPGTELTDAPYTRKSVVLTGPVGGVQTVDADVVFDISTSSNQNCQFFGYWSGTTYLGYGVPSVPRNFTEPASVRTFTLSAGSTIAVANP